MLPRYLLMVSIITGFSMGHVLASDASILKSHVLLEQSAAFSVNGSASASQLAQAVQPVAQQRRVRVFFPKYPEAMNDFTRVVAVERSTTNTSLARFAITQLIAGPTAAEQQRGLRPAVQLRGNSNCGADFTIAIANGLARLQFCRPVLSNGVGDDARAISAIEATLKQFSSVNSVIILNSDGRRLGDQS